jgi:hypothetical protein
MVFSLKTIQLWGYHHDDMETFVDPKDMVQGAQLPLVAPEAREFLIETWIKLSGD